MFSASCGRVRLNNIFIMFSLEGAEQVIQGSARPSMSALAHIDRLTFQIKQLQGVIALKDSALEEIDILIEHAIAATAQPRSLQIAQKALLNAEGSRYSEEERVALSREISTEIDASYSGVLLKLREGFQRILQRHTVELEIASLQVQPLQLPTKSDIVRLVEIPVEIQLQVDTRSEGVQVDLFESPKNSQGEEAPINALLEGEQEEEDRPIIREFPVFINAYEIPVEILLVDDISVKDKEDNPSEKPINSRNTDGELQDLQREVEHLRLENNTLKEELTKMRELPYTLEIEIIAPTGTIPIGADNSVEVPIEFVLQNDADSNMRVEIIGEEEAPQQTSSANHQTRPNIDSDQSLPKVQLEGQTRSEISQEHSSAAMSKKEKEPSIIMVNELKQSNQEAVRGKEETRIVEVPVELIRCIEVPVEVMRCIEVPVEVVVVEQVIKEVEVIRQVIREIRVPQEIIRQVQVPREVIKYVEVPKEVVKYVEVPIAKVEEVEVYSIMPVQIETEVPVLHEIPIELYLLQEESEQHSSLIQLNSQPPLQKNTIIDQPVQLQIELEIDEFDLTHFHTQVEKVVEVEKIVYIQKPIEVQKIVYVEKPVEVEKIVYVQRPVEVIKLMQVPVQLLLEVEKIVEYETIIERTNETVIENTKEVIIDHNIIVEIPVQLGLEEQPIQVEASAQEVAFKVESANVEVEGGVGEEEIEITDLQIIFEQQPVQRVEVIQKIVEVPVQVFIDRVVEVRVPVEVVRTVQVIKQVPIEVIKTVEVVKTVEVIKTVEVVKTVEVIKTVEVVRIVQVPVELQPEVKIIERYVPYVVEVPVQLKSTANIIQIPIEMEMEPLVYEVPIDVLSTAELMEIPIELQEPPIVIEVPVEMNVLEVEEISQSSPKKKSSQAAKDEEEEVQSPTRPLAIANYPQNSQQQQLEQFQLQGQPQQEQVYIIPLHESLQEIHIETNNNEIVLQIPIQIEQTKDNREAQSQTDERKPQQANNQQEIMVSQEDQSLFETLNILQGAEQPPEQQKPAPQLRIIELPVQLQLDNTEDLRKSLEYKYRERIADLHSQYSTEITSLHEMLQDLQKIIVEAQQEQEQLRDELENKALHEEALNNRLIQSEEALRERHEDIRALHDTIKSQKEDIKARDQIVKAKEVEISSALKKYDSQLEEYSALKQSYSILGQAYAELQSKWTELLQQPPVLYEMAVEMTVRREVEEYALQTEDCFPSDISVIEVPVEIEVVDKITESAIRRSEEEEVKSTSTHKYFKGYSEQELLEKLKAMTIKAEQIDHYTQTEKHMLQLYDSDKSSSKSISNVGDYTEFVQDAKKEEEADYTQFIKEKTEEHPSLFKNPSFYAANDQSQSRDVRLISGIQEYSNVIDEIEIHEYALQVFAQPIIYEVPIDIRVFKEFTISEVQTDDALTGKAMEICEIPVEIALKKETSENYSQTEHPNHPKHQHIFVDREASPTGHLHDCKEPYESRLIEIPLEFNIAVDKQAINIDIQTLESANENFHKQAQQTGTGEVFKQQPQSKLKITPAFEERIELGRSTEVVQGNPYETNHVIRLESACFSIPDHRILALASNNHSITLQQLYDDLTCTQRLLQSHPQPKLLADSADLKDIGQQQHNDIENSRVAVHIDEVNELHFEDIGELHEGVNKGSEIKQNYSELYENANNQIDRYRLLSQEKEEEIAELKRELELSQNRFEEQMKKLEYQNARLERTISQHERAIEEQKATIAEFSQFKAEEERKLEKLEQEYEKIKGYNTNLEYSSSKEIDKLKTIINEKIYEIKDLKMEEYQNKEMYEAAILELRANLAKKEDVIDQLEEENQRKIVKIMQLIEYQDELRKAIAEAKQSGQANATAIYEQEFQRVKEDFEERQRAMRDEVQAFAKEYERLKEELQAEARRNRTVSEQAQETQTTLRRIQEEYMLLLSLKDELENNYIDSLKDYNAQIQQCKEMIKEKDEIIQNLQNKSEIHPARLNQANPETNETHQAIRMEYLSRKVSREAEDPKIISTYIQKLEKLLLRYEKLLAGNEITIEQLQEKVCEYLRDALEKEQEAEMLYSKLVEYECAMNNILVEKITLEIENKRMCKAIELSERKVLILGNKLIEAVGKRPVQEEEDSDYYYQ